MLRWIKNLFVRQKDPFDWGYTPSTDSKINVWGIESGPFHRDEVGDPEVPEGLEYMLLCKIEIDGQILYNEYWFSDMDGVEKWQDHFRKKIEPLVINYD